MLQPKKPLDLSGANEILKSERPPLDLSGAESVLKKKDATVVNPKSASVTPSGSSVGKNSSGFPEIDMNSVAPGMGVQPQAETAKKETKGKIIQIPKPKKERGFASEVFHKLATGSAQLGADMAAVPELLYDAFAIPQNAIADYFNIPSLKADSEKFKKTIGVRNAVKDLYKSEVSKLREESARVDKKYAAGIYDSFKNGDVADGFRQLTNSFAESLPATSTIMLGGAYTKAPQLLAASTMMFGAGKNEQLKDENPDMSTNTRVVNALGTGLAEGAFETIGSGSIGAAARGIIEREGKKKAFSILRDGLVDFYKESLKKMPIVSSVTGEGVTGWATHVTQNAIDVATGVKPQDYNVFEGGADAFIGEAFGGAVFGGGLKGLEQVANYQDKNTIKANTKKIFELQKTLNNPEIPEALQAEIHKAIDGLIKTNQQLVQKNVDHVESLHPKIKEKILESIATIEEYKNKAKEIKLDNSIPDAAKKILLDKLKDDFKEANNFKNNTLEGKTTPVDVLPLKEQDKLKRQALKELTAEQNPDGTKNITIDDAQITERANKIYAKNEAQQETPVTETQQEAQPQAEAEKIELKNEGKADTPTKENIDERLRINHPFYQKVSDVLDKLGIINKYNPETKEGDVIGGYSQKMPDGGFSVGGFIFAKDGTISFIKDGARVEFDKNGNVISENTKEVAQKKKKIEIEGTKESITYLEKTRDSEAFKYIEVTETDVIGNRKKVKRLKTTQELKESTDKINATIDKAKARLTELEALNQATHPVEDIVVPSVSESKNKHNEISLSEQKTENKAETSSETVLNNQNEGTTSNDTPADGTTTTGVEPNGTQGENNSVPETVDTGSGENQTKVKKVKSVKDAVYDVHFDDNGNVSKIISPKDGREIPKFREVKKTVIDPVSKQQKEITVLQKNANYSKIEADATGGITNNKAKEERKEQVKKSLTSFEPSNEYEAALHYLAIGNGISSESSKKETGLSGKEVQWATQFKKNETLPSIERASEIITESATIPLDQTKVRNALIDILSSKKSVSELHDDVIAITEDKNKTQQEEELRTFMGSLSEKDFALVEAIMAEDSYLEELTNDEKLEYYEKQFGNEENIQRSNGLDGLRQTDSKPKDSSTSVQKREGEAKPSTQEKIAIAEAKIDDIANWLKEVLPSAAINPDDYKSQGLGQDQLIDIIAKAAKNLVSTGIEINDAITQVIDALKQKFDFEVDIDAVKGKINPKQESKEFESKSGERSLLKRLKEGGNPDFVNNIIDKIGLNYEKRKHEQVYADAVNFVKEVGLVNAYHAIKNGELKHSDTINVVYATILQEFPGLAEKELSQIKDADKLNDTTKELDAFYEKIYEEFAARTTDAGQGTAILNYIYNQDLKIRYSLSQQIKAFKKINNGTVPADVMAKFKELDKQYKEANKRIEELETLLQEAQEQKYFDNIIEEEKRNGDNIYTQEDFDRELQKSIDSIKKDIAKERKAKVRNKYKLTEQELNRKKELRNKFYRANDVTGVPALLLDPEFREYIGLVFKQAKGDIAVFSSEILATLGKTAKKHLPNLFDEAKSINTPKTGKLSISEDNKITIPNSLIRSLVESGYDDINKLTAKILADNKEEFPDLTERDIRDAITKYGRVVEPNNVDPAPLIRKIKRAGKAISAMEDIAKGIRPKRSGLQRDKLSPEERKILRDINESMKNLPKDTADLSKHLKTSLDAIKTRLSNHIEDLNKQIAEEKKWSKDKSSIELDQEAKDLVAKRDSLKIALDELVNVPKTEDEIYNERIASKLAEREKVLQGLIEGKKNDPTGRKSDWSAEISKVNTEISRLREKQKAIQSQKTPDEIYQKEVEAKINSLKKRIDDVKIGKVKDTEGNSSVWNNEISELETELKNLKDGKKVVNEPKVTVDDNGKVRIPTEMIKNYISKGGTDLSEFAKQVQESIKDEFPDVTVRDVRESVSNYGKKVNKTRNQLLDDIRSLKTEDRLRLEYEDLQKGISKEKNEIKKLKLTQEASRLKAQIKQLQDSLGITEEERTNRSVNYTKKRIELLKEKIKNRDFSKKEVKPIVQNQELKDALIEKNRIQEEFDYIKHQHELENRTLSDRASDLLSDLYDSQRVTLATGEMSFVGAQGGFYMVDATFSRKALKNLVSNFKGTTLEEWKKAPYKTLLKIAKSAHTVDAMINLFDKMGTANNYLDFQRLMKEDPNYDTYLKAGLRILGEDVKSQVRDDHFYGNNLLTLLKIPILGVDLIKKKETLNNLKSGKLKIAMADEGKKRTTLQGYYEKLKTGKVSDKNKKTATEIFSNANPLSMFERGNTVFMNMARKEMFDKYAESLYMAGKNPIDHIDDFKKLASAVNTITGSGNMNQTVTMALPVLNKLMFSARYFAASWNLTPPFSLYYLYKLGDLEITEPKSWKDFKPTAAQKAFVKPMLKGFTVFYGITLATVAMINSSIDDDDEMDENEKKRLRARIEYDPRSSDFMQVISGNTRTDYFGPYRNNIVLLSKLTTGQSLKNGEIIENGAKFGSRRDFDIGAEYLAGKANPFPGMFLRYAMGKKEDVVNEETGVTESLRMLYDDRVDIGYQVNHNLFPIFATTVKDIVNEDPVLGAEFYTLWALFGKQTSVYSKSSGATPEEKFMESQAKKKALYELPESEKDKNRGKEMISSAKSDVKYLEEMKIAKSKKLPYYISQESMIPKEKVQEFDLSNGEKSIREIKKFIEDTKIKYNIKDEE